MLDPQDASTLSVLRRAVLVLLASVLLPILRMPRATQQQQHEGNRRRFHWSRRAFGDGERDLQRNRVHAFRNRK